MSWRQWPEEILESSRLPARRCIQDDPNLVGFHWDIPGIWFHPEGQVAGREQIFYNNIATHNLFQFTLWSDLEHEHIFLAQVKPELLFTFP